MEKIDFKPVVLGIDVGAYSIARTFYEYYKVKTIVIGKYTYWMTSYSKITEALVVSDMTEERLINYLIDLKGKYPNTKLLLFGCSEDYVDIIIRNKEVLDKYYVVPTVDIDTLNRVVLKENFYEVCEKVGINYPKTIILNKDNYKKEDIKFKYPIVAKASNKAIYQRIKFDGKMKVFIFNDHDELVKMLTKAFDSGYTDDFVVQEYISGADSNMRVLTCFADQNSNVLFSSVGKVLLEEKGPDVTGNYSAIVNIEDEKLVEAAKKFIKETNYKGYANFDIKYDDNTKDFYFFEVNVRLGRSNYYMAANGINYLEPVVDAYIYNNPKDNYVNEGCSLYRIVPFYIIRKYVKDKTLVKEVKRLKKNNPLDYKKDFSLKEKVYIYMALINHIRKFRDIMNKVVGVIGGMGPMATAKFIELVIDNTEANKDQDNVGMLICNYASIPDRTSYILGKSENDPSKEMINAAKVLEKEHCAFLVMPCNTATYFYDKIQNNINIPLLNIVEETVKYCLIKKNVHKIGLMATDGTIKSGIYKQYMPQDVELFLPSKEIQKKVMDIIYKEVKQNKIPKRDNYLNVINYFKNSGCDLIVMGCTELSVALKQLDIKDKMIVDSLTVLARNTILKAGKKLKR